MNGIHFHIPTPMNERGAAVPQGLVDEAERQCDRIPLGPPLEQALTSEYIGGQRCMKMEGENGHVPTHRWTAISSPQRSTGRKYHHQWHSHETPLKALFLDEYEFQTSFVEKKDLSPHDNRTLDLEQH